MKSETTTIYVKLSEERQEAVFSGIKFVDFIECTPISIENILLLKGDYSGEKCWRKLELLEGRDNVIKLMRENINNYGDFCFVDYADGISISQLSEEQIAELLYLAHMYKPLKSPFFEVLKNKFAYLAHDDGWYCKLYCEDREIAISILLNKLRKSIQEVLHDNGTLLPSGLTEEIYKLSTRGLLIKLDNEVTRKNKVVIINLYEVGEYENMDDLFNTIDYSNQHISFKAQSNKN